MEGGQKPKRELEYSSSVKRLLSPPQESNSVKRSRSDVESAPLGSSGEVTRPVKTFRLSNGQSDGIARGAGVVSHGDKGQTSICRRDVDLETGFTGIVEQRFREEKACGSPAALHTANSACKPSADAPTRGVHRGGQQDQTDPNKAQTGTTSNQKPSGGKVEQLVAVVVSQLFSSDTCISQNHCCCPARCFLRALDWILYQKYEPVSALCNTYKPSVFFDVSVKMQRRHQCVQKMRCWMKAGSLSRWIITCNQQQWNQRNPGEKLSAHSIN